MTKFFIKGNTFAAPFFSSPVEDYIEAHNSEHALNAFAKRFENDHIGLYYAAAYYSADDYHMSKKPLAEWKSNHLISLEKAKGYKSYSSVFVSNPGEFEVNGIRHTVENPKEGRVLS